MPSKWAPPIEEIIVAKVRELASEVEPQGRRAK